MCPKMAAPNHMRLALTGTCATAAAGATGAAATATAGAPCGAMGVTGVTGATAGGAWLPEGAAPPKGAPRGHREMGVYGGRFSGNLTACYGKSPLK